MSDRAAQLTIKINDKYQRSIIQAYLPTTSHADEDAEKLHEHIDNLISNSEAQFKIVMGESRKTPIEDMEHILQETTQ